MPQRKLTPGVFLASLLGAGFLPWAPGTFGSLVAAGIYLLLPKGLFSGTGWFYYGIGLILFSGVSVFLSTHAEKKLGHDAPQIVIDEACGYFLSVFLLPRSLLMAVYGFALFRVFDIAKPWPVNVSQKLPRGWGVVADDLIAGVYANVLIQIIKLIVPKFFGQ